MVDMDTMDMDMVDMDMVDIDMVDMDMFTMSISTMSVSSPDDKLSENIWFVWFKTSHDGDKWRCYHGDKQTTRGENRASQQIDQGWLTFAINNYITNNRVCSCVGSNNCDCSISVGMSGFFRVYIWPVPFF